MECDVCDGIGKIRLPVMTKPSMRFSGQPKTDWDQPVKDASREFLCPQCTDRIPDEHVFVWQASETINTMYRDIADMRPYVRRHIAQGFAQALLENDLIEWRETQDEFTITTRGRLGVASKSHVASLEGRAKITAREWLELLQQALEREIELWRSNSGDKVIEKWRVASIVEESIRKVGAKI